MNTRRTASPRRQGVQRQRLRSDELVFFRVDVIRYGCRHTAIREDRLDESRLDESRRDRLNERRFPHAQWRFIESGGDPLRQRSVLNLPT